MDKAARHLHHGRTSSKLSATYEYELAMAYDLLHQVQSQQTEKNSTWVDNSPTEFTLEQSAEMLVRSTLNAPTKRLAGLRVRLNYLTMLA